jgi:hypothetical protein
VKRYKELLNIKMKEKQLSRTALESKNTTKHCRPLSICEERAANYDLSQLDNEQNTMEAEAEEIYITY